MSKINEYLKTTIMICIIIQIAPHIIQSLYQRWEKNIQPSNKVAHISIHGSIENSSYYRKHLTQFFRDNSIKAILLTIESGGGAAGSCQALAFEIETLKKEFPKPIITYTENICASGAYEIAAETDYIVATGSAIIGSIGAKISPIFNIQELLKQYNVECQEIAAGSYKNTMSLLSPLTQDQQQMLQSLVDNSYQQLYKQIAHKRHLQIHKLDQWGCGKIFTGQQAYDLKLVDALGSKTTAINLIKKNIIPSDREIEWVYAQKPTTFSLLFGQQEDEESGEYLESSMFYRLLYTCYKQFPRIHTSI